VIKQPVSADDPNLNVDRLIINKAEGNDQLFENIYSLKIEDILVDDVESNLEPLDASSVEHIYKMMRLKYSTSPESYVMPAYTSPLESLRLLSMFHSIYNIC
jgi:hypothetical protein